MFSVKEHDKTEEIIWSHESTTSYDMLDFKSYTKSLKRTYLVIERQANG